MCEFRGILSQGAAAHPVLCVQSVVLFIVLSAVCAPCPGRACSPCRPVSYNPDLDNDQSVPCPPILPIHQFAYLSPLLALSCPITTKITICPSIHLFVCSSTCLSAISLLPLYFTLVRVVTFPFRLYHPEAHREANQLFSLETPSQKDADRFAVLFERRFPTTPKGTSSRRFMTELKELQQELEETNTMYHERVVNMMARMNAIDPYYLPTKNLAFWRR